jgi:Protein of unknown function (DUF3455)
MPWMHDGVPVMTVACCAALSIHCARADALPPAIDAPGETKVLALHAEGAQIYECKADTAGKLAWTFREPIATLLSDGKTVGRHYVGPRWELTDGGVLEAKAVTKAAGATPADIPWLKLEVSAREADEKLAAVTTIQRINTKGGALDGACDKAGDLRAVAYTADYVFLRK